MKSYLPSPGSTGERELTSQHDRGAIPSTIGSSYGGRYGWLSSLLAASLLVKRSAAASQSRTAWDLCAMLARIVVLVLRWPVSMSAVHFSRVLMQSRKLRACDAASWLPRPLTGSMAGLPSRQFLAPARSSGERIGYSRAGGDSGTTS